MAAGAPANTWRLPPHAKAADPAATVPGGKWPVTGNHRERPEQDGTGSVVGPAATPGGGSAAEAASSTGARAVYSCAELITAHRLTGVHAQGRGACSAVQLCLAEQSTSVLVASWIYRCSFCAYTAMHACAGRTS